jgi:hypothetical protein
MNHMTTERAAQIIARARESWANNPETDGDADAFDLHIATVGVEPFGELYQEVYALANEGHEVNPSGGEAQMNARKECAARLWEELLPGLEMYATECRTASRTGWSR